MSGLTTIVLQNYLDSWRDGDDQARDELIARSCERLRRLTRTILHTNFARVRATEETDDVLQTALLRLMTPSRRRRRTPWWPTSGWPPYKSAGCSST